VKPARGFSPILIPIAVTLLLGLTVFVFRFINISPKSVITNVLTKPSPSPAIKTYETQKECESATGKSCAILMCDVVPEGKTFEETCGQGFKTGWAPSKLNNNLRPSPSDEITNWKIYQGKYFSFKYPDHWTENTSPETLRSKLTLETKGLRIGVSVFDVDYFDQAYNLALQDFKHRESIEISVQGKKATKFITKGIGDPLPVDYSIITIVVESIPGRNYQINFNGPNKEITNELINQILSTFKFLD